MLASAALAANCVGRWRRSPFRARDPCAPSIHWPCPRQPNVVQKLPALSRYHAVSSANCLRIITGVVFPPSAAQRPGPRGCRPVWRVHAASLSSRQHLQTISMCAACTMLHCCQKPLRKVSQIEREPFRFQTPCQSMDAAADEPWPMPFG